MTGFAIGAVLALAITLLLLLRPLLWRRDAAATASHRQLNAAIYRDQFAELERDHNEGTLTDADYRQAREELQRRVLEDGHGEDVSLVQRAPKKTLLTLGLGLPLAAAAIYLLLGNPAGLQPPQQQHRFSMQEIESMVAGLAAKLEKEPNNLEGWVMLGRSYKAMRRFGEAEKAFDRAAPLVEQDPQLLAIYADIAAMNAGGRLEGKPARLIDKALKLDPQNAQALWLSGSVDFEGGRYGKAVATWERLLKSLPADSEDAKQLAGAIAEARAKGGSPAAPVAALDVQKAVRGRVELAAALRDKAAPDDTVMVIAREAGGPRIPVAVLRARAADLPLDFVLDDSLAAMRDRTISSVKAVEVEARISKSGMAAPEKGDLLSPVQNAKVGATGLRLIVDRVRP